MNGDDNIGNHLVLGETYKDSRILESLRCVEVVTRPSEDQLSFEDKIRRLTEQAEIDKKQLTLFAEAVPAEMRNLDFLDDLRAQRT